MMAEALKPLHDPKLRDLIVTMKKSLEQVIDEVTQDDLILAGYDARSLEKAQALVSDFRVFIEANKDELEAIQVLYSRPYRAGLRFRQVKELAEALKRPPLSASPERVWQAFEAIEPDAVKGKGGKSLTDLIALVRHALDPASPIVPFATTVEERYRKWFDEQEGRRRCVHWATSTAMARRHPGPHRQEPADRPG